MRSNAAAEVDGALGRKYEACNKQKPLCKLFCSSHGFLAIFHFYIRDNMGT